MQGVKILAAVSLLVLLGACATTVKRADVGVPIQVETGEKPRPIQFRKIVVNLNRGDKIGTIYGGLLDVPMDDIVWRGGRVPWSNEELSVIFREELEKANYEIVGDPDALFEDPSLWKAELLVAGNVKEIDATVRYPWAGYGMFNRAKGEAYMRVDWQVYSRLDSGVVYRTSTEGTGIVEKARKMGDQDIYFEAFAMATRNLLADAGFHDTVTSESVPLASVPKDMTLTVNRPWGGAIADRMNDVRSAVVTVFAGDGHGSGTIIDQSGYVITNYHVVGEAKFVKVRLTTGREILGEVNRKSKPRDVALIKIEEGNLPALPLRATDVEIGSEVYAIGTPIDVSLATTVSKGIVSSFRDMDGKKMIQSDVSVSPGNSGGPLVDSSGSLAGIAVSRHAIADQVSFFIPIHDALDKLGIAISQD